MKSEDQALIDAMNERLRRDRAREERSKREVHPRAWTPPRCARKGCSHAAAIEERDYQPDRGYFCSVECFRIVRDGIHGARGVLVFRQEAASEPQKSTETAEGEPWTQ